MIPTLGRPPGGDRVRLTSRAAVLAVVVCAIALSLAYPVREYIAQRRQIDQLQAERQVLNGQLQALQHEQQRLADPAYIEQLARNKLHMCLKGQTCSSGKCVSIVGTGEISPTDAEVAVHERILYHFSWTVPTPETWHDLDLLVWLFGTCERIASFGEQRYLRRVRSAPRCPRAVSTAARALRCACSTRRGCTSIGLPKTPTTSRWPRSPWTTPSVACFTPSRSDRMGGAFIAATTTRSTTRSRRCASRVASR